MTFDDYWEERKERTDEAHYMLMSQTWNEARQTDPVKKQMYDTLKNIENDDNSIPDTIWGMLLDAIVAYEREQNDDRRE